MKPGVVKATRFDACEYPAYVLLGSSPLETTEKLNRWKRISNTRLL